MDDPGRSNENNNAHKKVVLSDRVGAHRFPETKRDEHQPLGKPCAAFAGEERNQLPIDVQQLEAEIENIKEDNHLIDGNVDYTTAALKDAREAIAAANECCDTSTFKAFEEALDNYAV